MKETIIKALEKIVKELSAEDISSKGRWSSGPKIHLTIPQDSKNGDYTTNIAMQLFAKVKDKGLAIKSPLELAQKIVEKLGSIDGLEKVKAVKPGFINFYLSPDVLTKKVEAVLQTPEEIAGIVENLAGKKIIVEFTDPNPFKEFHICHLYSLIVGESICRLLEAQGAEIKRVTYQGDVGLHVAKAVWGIFEKLEIAQTQVDQWRDDIHQVLNEKLDNLAQKDIQEISKFLGEPYALGYQKYETSQVEKNQIDNLNKKIYSREDPIINEVYDRGKQWSLDYFAQIYNHVGTEFWRNYFESEAGEKGQAIVKEHIVDGIFEKDGKAIVFRGEKYGLHTRVFINSLGLPTYEAKELGLAPTKYKEYPYDLSIIITGNEINEYFKVLLKVLSLINPVLASKTKHISHGMVRLPEGKMSSRTGKVITGEWLLDEAYKKASNLAKHTLEIEGTQGISMSFKTGMGALKNGMKPSELLNSTEKVAMGAVKYAFLKTGIGKDLEFDFETSLSLNGNSGPYIQYAYTRTQSVLKKAQSSDIKPRLSQDYTVLEDEKKLMQKLVQFREFVQNAAENYSPNIIVEYLFQTAKLFNNFYQKYRIVNAERKEEQEFRLALTQAVGIILKQGLNLLGIQAPERM